MTKIKIEYIEDGAFYDDFVWDFWITVLLENKAIVKLFDSQGLNLKEQIGSTVYGEIRALYLQIEEEEGLYCFEGIIRNYDNRFLFYNDFIEILIDNDGILGKVSLNTKGIYYFGRLDLVNYQLLL